MIPRTPQKLLPLKGRWLLSSRPYSGVEDSLLAPGVRYVATAHGYVLLIATEGKLHGNMFLAGRHLRGWYTPRTADEIPGWKEAGAQFLRAAQRHLRERAARDLRCRSRRAS